MKVLSPTIAKYTTNALPSTRTARDLQTSNLTAAPTTASPMPAMPNR